MEQLAIPGTESLGTPRAKAQPIAVRFWPKVKKTRGCWWWRASVDKDGYGQIGGWRLSNRTMLKAHRVSWEFAFGAVPAGLCVLHRCDNRRCVKPRHLFLGTVADNNRDMNEKGRNVFQSSRNPALKLTAGQVREIRARRARGVRLVVLARRFRVAESTISRIANGVRRFGGWPWSSS